MGNLISVIVVALLSVFGNIVYFEYKSKRESGVKILQLRLVNLLLPLYYTLKIHDLEWHIYTKSSDLDPYEYESDKPEELLKKLGEIIKNNLYLADNKLHVECLNFLEWAYKSDSNERFQRLHQQDFDLKEDVIFNKFQETVYDEYRKTKESYLKFSSTATSE